ncbi:MAG: glycine dehydrogenase (aminomethyl-transferring) [Bacteroidetes bacterium]|nr:MAG: glycine dehydrogenase (aminomethyl-transferring) [Bacteroidota bacterium]
MLSNNFIDRHNGPRENEIPGMLDTIGVKTLEELIAQTVPASIRMKNELDLPDGMNEHEYINHLREIGAKNKLFKSYIGMGYYNTILPGVIQRNILENPGWYTSYTPYQAEISQGRLEALLNFQTMVSDLTAMPLANASLLDEGTAAAEAMIMLYNARSRAAAKAGLNKFFISEGLFPQTKEVVKARALPLGIEIITGNEDGIEFVEGLFGALIQYPDQFGEVKDYRSFVEQAHEKEVAVAVAADLLSLALLSPPGEWGADVVVGTTQRFGVPMGYGGPHAAYFATHEKYKRNIPGRIIGQSVDAEGNPALRMALQTREQHIKRERATSNICTAQALLAIMAGMYGAYHGPEGLKAIARDINDYTCILGGVLQELGMELHTKQFFDTLVISLPDDLDQNAVMEVAVQKEINFRYFEDGRIGISLDETTSAQDARDIISVFVNLRGFEPTQEHEVEVCVPQSLCRTSEFMIHEIFNSMHSETEMMRYMKKLENRDLALNRTMIPLGSCTMKLNAAAELFPLSWPEFGALHPFVPEDQAEGYTELIENLGSDLCEITGFSAMSFQPNSGASGEYTGLLVIKAYHESRGEGYRNICLIPSSAHGTNPASSVMAGMKVVIVKCDEQGNIDIDDLKARTKEHHENLAAIMITYPSTHGVFEESVLDIMDIIHEHGGQVYMDGANMNAQVGLTSPGLIGADVCHLNLHKTFAIPHGGGGPGVGPIGVAEHLAEFLPGSPVVETGGQNAIGAVAAAPFGSAMILPISYGYIKLLGRDGLRIATEMAILNANYLKTKLEKHYKILYTGKNGRVAHEMILDCNQFLKTADVMVVDIAKRLMDFGFHAPTVAFPVIGTLMVEPTESEPLSELDRFVEAMMVIREEIRQVEEGNCSKEDNMIKHAPHTLAMVMDEDWKFPYSKKDAAFPNGVPERDKYWPDVTRIDDAQGDRNLICTCGTPEDYVEK